MGSWVGQQGCWGRMLRSQDTVTEAAVGSPHPKPGHCRDAA